MENNLSLKDNNLSLDDKANEDRLSLNVKFNKNNILFNKSIIFSQAIKMDLPIILQETENVLQDTLIELKPLTILEIGTANGYSATCILEVCKNAKLTTLEKDEERAKIATENLKKHNAKVINCDAIDFLNTTKDKFDFIFLDGPKGQYLKYFKILENLINIGGIIFVDNINFHGMVNGKTPITKGVRTMVRNLQNFNQYVLTNINFDSIILEKGDGIIIAKKK